MCAGGRLRASIYLIDCNWLWVALQRIDWTICRPVCVVCAARKCVLICEIINIRRRRPLYVLIENKRAPFRLPVWFALQLDTQLRCNCVRCVLALPPRRMGRRLFAGAYPTNNRRHPRRCSHPLNGCQRPVCWRAIGRAICAQLARD